MTLSAALLVVALPAWCGPASLQPGEAARLRALAEADPSAKAQYRGILERAKTALAAKPSPIERIATEGKLRGDPGKARTDAALRDMGEARDLALAFALTGDRVYLMAAKGFLLAWAGVNKACGDPIDETNLEPMIEAYDLVRGELSPEDRAAVDAWLTDVATTEIDRRKARAGTSVNNWHSHRLKIIGLVGWTVGDKRLQEYAFAGFRDQLAENLLPDGSSIDFRDRDAVHYHAYDLEALLRLAILLKRAGAEADPYREAAPSGASLKRSVAFLVGFADGTKSHAEFVGSKVSFDKARGKNGEKGYAAGTPFDPKNAAKALESAQYFEPGLLGLVASLEGKAKSKVPSLRVFLNEGTRP